MAKSTEHIPGKVVFTPRAIQTAVYEGDLASGITTRRLELEFRGWDATGEDRPAATDRDRDDLEPELIDRARGAQLLNGFDAAEDHDRLAGPALRPFTCVVPSPVTTLEFSHWSTSTPVAVLENTTFGVSFIQWTNCSVAVGSTTPCLPRMLSGRQ
jgi:hypothetical protein